MSPRLHRDISSLFLILSLIITITQAHDRWGGSVITLDDKTFDKKVLDSEEIWLVVFYAPWCGHCKRLQPEYEESSRIIKKEGIPNIKLGAIDASEYQSYAQKYGIRGFPTLLYFPAGPKTQSDAKPYEGDRSSSSIVQWAREMASEFKPTPEVQQLTSDKQLHDTCDNSQICIISVLPQLYDCQSKCRNRYINRLKEVSEHFKTRPWGYLWAEANAYADLEKSLGIGGFGYPALAAVNIRKKAFSIMKGPFSTEGITEFLTALSYGQEGSSNIKGDELPKISETKPWDGKDKVLPTIEDEL